MRHLHLAQLLLLLGAVAVGCGGAAESPPRDSRSSTAGSNSWVDATEESGLRFRHETGAAGALLLPEIMAGGVALFDADGDDDLDIYLTNGRTAPGGGGAEKAVNRLFLQHEPGRFVDATERSGLGDPGYGMGVAIGDIDNDGDRDVYLTNHGPDRLYRNRGDGTFEDVTATAGIDVDGWSSSACFFDPDGDGWLDLYVARYVRHESTKRCTDSAGRPDYCSPSVFAPELDVLLRNRGDGTFRDISAPAGIRSAAGAGLGVACVDLTSDGRPDVYVANDGHANLLWVNQGDGTFREQAVLMGVAYNMDGQAEAGMGVVADDLDNDLDIDLFLTHLTEETHTLYRNRGGTQGFDDVTGPVGLAASSVRDTGFGAAAIDLELDGDLDLLVANGRVTFGIAPDCAADPAPWSRFAEPNRVFVNDGVGVFRAVTEGFESFRAPCRSSRGLAVGDLDADGDLDAVVTNVQSAARLYLNETPRAGNWLAVAARDPRYRRDAIGAAVTVITAERRLTRFVTRGSSYQSSSDARAHFGLGPVTLVEAIEVLWPDGRVERFEVDSLDTTLVLERGSGTTR